MRKPAVVALVVVLALIALGGIGFAVFEHHERGGLVAKSERPCDGREKPVAGGPASLPLGLPATAGVTLLNVATQGSTTVAFGYTVEGTDQEPGYEAEAELAGTHEGTLKVSPLCTGLLEVRYKIEQ